MIFFCETLKENAVMQVTSLLVINQRKHSVTKIKKKKSYTAQDYLSCLHKIINSNLRGRSLSVVIVLKILYWRLAGTCNTAELAGLFLQLLEISNKAHFSHVILKQIFTT